MVYLIVYDIADDRCRSKISKYLEGIGQRVQESVFECRMDVESLPKTMAKLQKLKTDEGNIRIYPVCLCGAVRERFRAPGGEETRLRPVYRHGPADSTSGGDLPLLFETSGPGAYRHLDRHLCHQLGCCRLHVLLCAGLSEAAGLIFEATVGFPKHYVAISKNLTRSKHASR